MATAELQGERIVVSTVWSEKELVKLLPGARWDPDERHWHVPVADDLGDGRTNTTS
jgi:hypothetical protein